MAGVGKEAGFLNWLDGTFDLVREAAVVMPLAGNGLQLTAHFGKNLVVIASFDFCQPLAV